MTDIIDIGTGDLRASISALGAELQSLTTDDGRDWLWHGDPVWWSGRSPILFPIVGKAPNGQIAIAGKTYAMAQHGFARRSRFELIAHTEDSCEHQLVSSDETRGQYPFDFCLSLAHRVDGRSLVVTAKVQNRDEGPLPFGIGFHPAFRWPLPGADGKAHYVSLDNGQSPKMIQLEDGLIGQSLPGSPFRAGRLELEHHLFDHDALIFPEGAGTGLTYGAEGGPSLHFTFENLPNIALWQKPGAPFLCVEPWHGMAAHAGGTAEITERPYTIALAKGQDMCFSFRLTLDG
ncbi:aldose 1-epimerase family protein [Peteryoungia desertarenae]|uniref:Aldose 1-epimerase family protein n=1 Tax=Peteryoungia desertarenae TaxID=1813451 RepID=A0ABX6QI74_9HYPH|nr:aldose 1-epimerase family protein [Peteryoungia desertarenae]QLF68263.1 aldose 1-epimerase family protein [Peteryoungia desertarenae]